MHQKIRIVQMVKTKRREENDNKHNQAQTKQNGSYLVTAHQKTKPMDEIVKQAMCKWPDVPHCYGWLALDARGNWRMRDEQCQAKGALGDNITHTALRAFIQRNYTCDAQGSWYFQNGPQRVYVDLEATPFIARIDGSNNFVDQAGQTITDVTQIWMTEFGQLILQSAEKVAQLDDRDLAQCLADVRLNGAVASDEMLVAWMYEHMQAGVLSLHLFDQVLSVKHILTEMLPECFGFVKWPSVDSGRILPHPSD